MAFCNSISLCNCSSWSSASLPALAFTLSIFVSISFSVRIYCNPASSPGPPNISARAVPTAAELSGNSASLAETSCIISNVVLLPFSKSSRTFADDMPMLSNASAVADVISRIRRLPSLITSIALSEYIPAVFACVVIAINSLADNPASLKYAGYSLTFSKNSPLASAPDTKPSLMSFRASSKEMPNCFASAFVDMIVSLKSLS